MSLTTINLTGTVLPPNNVAVGGTVTFELSSVVIDATSGVIVPRAVSTPILAGGNIDLDIWPNALGSFPTYYTVIAYTPAEEPGRDPRRIILGTIQLPATPSEQDIKDYLASYAAPVPPAQFWSSITQAEYDAAIQAAIDAVAAAEQAVAFGSIYTNPDLDDPLADPPVVGMESITIPADVDVVQRLPSVAGQVAPPNIVSRWRRNASPGAEAFWTDATGATFTVAEITQAEILSTLTSALDAAFTDPAFSGSANFANGTAAAPSMRFSSDPDTGVYRNGTNSIGFTAGGTRRAFLSSTAMQVDVPITGTAVVSSDSDVTAGRLLKTAAGPAQAFRRGNILGTVSQAGGVPTGAVIERGSNANGRYVRFSDGTQICTHQITSNSASAVTWTYPVSFSGGLDAFLGLANGPDRIVTQSADNSANTTQAAFHAWTLTVGPIARTTYPCRLVAIGRWF